MAKQTHPNPSNSSGPDVSKNEPINYYKIATLVLSVITVVIAIVSGVYYKRLELSRNFEEATNRLIERLQDRRLEIESIPTIDVDITSLNDAGLPATMLESLQIVPASVVLKHKSGGTVGNITLVVHSSRKIVDVAVDSPLEQTNFTISDDLQQIKIEVVQMRPSSSVAITITTNGVSRIDVQTAIEVGREYAQIDNSQSIPISSLFETNISGVDPARFHSSEEIERAIQVLQARANIKPQILPTWLLIVFGPIVYFGLAIGFVFARRVLRRRKRLPLEQRLGRAITEGLIKPGMSSAEIELVLRDIEYSACFITKEDGTTSTGLFYVLPAIQDSWAPDLLVEVVDDKATEIRFIEYGKRDYTN